MNLEQKYSIKDVSGLLSLPKSTIRYWDEQGLIKPARKENGYRQFDLEDIFKIYDIAFYRKMGISIKDMQNLYLKKPEELFNVLDATERKLATEIREMKRKYQEIKKKKQHFELLAHLEAGVFVDDEMDFDQLITIDVNNRQDLKIYMEYSASLGIFGDGTPEAELKYGICLSAAEAKRKAAFGYLIWQRSTACLYKSFLLKVHSEHTATNNIAEYQRALSQQGFRSGQVIGRYLLITTENQQQVEYYQGWIEVFPKAH